MNFSHSLLEPSSQKLPDEFDNHWMYFYEGLFRCLFRNRRPVVSGYLLIVIVWGAVTLWADITYSASLMFIDWWGYYIIFCVITGHAIIATQVAKKRLRQYLSDLINDYPPP
jgi:hypothetical protein